MYLATGGIGGAGETLDFEAAAVRDGIALGFFDQHDDILVGVSAGWILR